jgi:hypothetical protein
MNDILVEGIILPDKPLSNFELLDAVNKLKIKNFRGIFMRDELSQKPNKKECGILNLDDAGNNPPGNNGTHWVCWFCRGNGPSYYFDSFGLSPPLEIQQYLRGQIEINISQVQPFGTNICGHLCLYILNKLSNGEKLKNIIGTLIE